MKYFILTTIFFSNSICFAQKNTTILNKKLEERHVKNRQDSSTWDSESVQKEKDGNKERKARPFRFGAYPVPKYELIGSESFKGIGSGENFSGINTNGKTVFYSYFFVNKNALTEKYIGNKPNEVFFTIVVLTNFVDTTSFTHAGAQVISRNNPDYLGKGFFKIKNDEIEYTAFLTADRTEYAIVNMRLFNLKKGRIILITP